MDQYGKVYINYTINTAHEREREEHTYNTVAHCEVARASEILVRSPQSTLPRRTTNLIQTYKLRTLDMNPFIYDTFKQTVRSSCSEENGRLAVVFARTKPQTSYTYVHTQNIHKYSGIAHAQLINMALIYIVHTTNTHSDTPHTHEMELLTHSHQM